jgi:uncharacterized membrane protein YedE/YeeE
MSWNGTCSGEIAMASIATEAMLRALLGGVVIGLSALGLLAFNGRIAGVSGILGGVLFPRRADTGWRVSFLAGLVGGGYLVAALVADPFRGLQTTPYVTLGLAGLLVGFGASLGSGCTSGHGVCGVGRLSPRSIVATSTFMAAGGLAVYVARHVLGAFP